MPAPLISVHWRWVWKPWGPSLRGAPRTQCSPPSTATRPVGPHLPLWYSSEAQVLVGPEGVLHGVHGETIEGSLRAHIVLEVFDHRSVEPGRGRGTSVSLCYTMPCVLLHFCGSSPVRMPLLCLHTPLAPMSRSKPNAHSPVLKGCPMSG